MILISQAPNGALSATSSLSSPAKFVNANPSLFAHHKPKFITKRNQVNVKPLLISYAKAEGSVESGSASNSVAPTSTSSSSSSSSSANDEMVFVGGKDVPLEGVIQFEKPSSNSSRFQKWG